MNSTLVEIVRNDKFQDGVVAGRDALPALVSMQHTLKARLPSLVLGSCHWAKFPTRGTLSHWKKVTGPWFNRIRRAGGHEG